jgi:hypothetical protein
VEKIPISTSLKMNFAGVKCFIKSINNHIITI